MNNPVGAYVVWKSSFSEVIPDSKDADLLCASYIARKLIADHPCFVSANMELIKCGKKDTLISKIIPRGEGLSYSLMYVSIA